jgi:hypothetical protein
MQTIIKFFIKIALYFQSQISAFNTDALVVPPTWDSPDLKSSVENVYLFVKDLFHIYFWPSIPVIVVLTILILFI